MQTAKEEAKNKRQTTGAAYETLTKKKAAKTTRRGERKRAVKKAATRQDTTVQQALSMWKKAANEVAPFVPKNKSASLEKLLSRLRTGTLSSDRKRACEVPPRKSVHLDPDNIADSILRPLQLEWSAPPKEKSNSPPQMDTGIVAPNSITRLVMLTTDGPDMPGRGYLVPATLGSSPYCDCVRVLLTKGDSGSDTVTLTAGRLRVSALERFKFAVSTKQTRHQNWLQQIWIRAGFGTETGGMRDLGDKVFVGVENIDKTTVSAKKLAIMLLWAYWHRNGVKDEAKIADLAALKLPNKYEGSAIGTIIQRMELKQCAVPSSPQVSQGTSAQ